MIFPSCRSTFANEFETAGRGSDREAREIHRGAAGRDRWRRRSSRRSPRSRSTGRASKCSGSTSARFRPIIPTRTLRSRRSCCSCRRACPRHASTACTASCPTSSRPRGARPTSLKSIAGDPPFIDLAARRRRRRWPRRVDISGPSPRLSAEARGEGVETCPVIPVYDAPKPPPRRLTLTLPVLARAGVVVVAACGASKAAAMRGALHESGVDTPIAELLAARLRLSCCSIARRDYHRGQLSGGESMRTCMS